MHSSVRSSLFVLLFLSSVSLIYAQPAARCATSPTEQDLFDAIHRADADRVAALLAAGVSANSRAEIKSTTYSPEETICATALMHAAWGGELRTIKALLDGKADPDAQDNRGRLVWAYAIGEPVLEKIDDEQLASQMDRRLEMTKLLLASGARLNFNGQVNETPVFHAVASAGLSGDMRILKTLIAAGADLNDKRNGSLLFNGIVSARHRLRPGKNEPATETEIIKTLLAGGANVNAHEGAALYVEAEGSRTEGCAERIKLLLDAGADIHLTYSVDVLHTAINGESFGQDRRYYSVEALHDQIEVVKLLLAAGANVNAMHNGASPLHSAFAAYDHHQMNSLRYEGLGLFKVLIKAGADVNAVNVNGDTVLARALSGQYEGDKVPEGREPLVGLLIESGADVNFPNARKRTPLMLAIQNDSDDMVRALLWAKAKVNVQDGDGLTPLMAAIYGRRFEVVKLLIESKADLKAVDKNGQTPLMLAVLSYWYWPRLFQEPAASREVIQILLDAKADPNATDRNGDTPLTLAVRNSCDDATINSLIKAGARVNVTNNEGDTALLIAARLFGSNEGRNRHPPTVNAIKILLAGGADVNALARSGESALTMIAGRNPSTVLPIIDELLTAGRRTGSSVPRVIDLLVAIRRAAGHSSAEVVKKLISTGADVNGLDENGRPLLFVAIEESGNAEVVRALLAAGAKLNVKDLNGDTPLIAALREYSATDNGEIRNALRRDTETIAALLAAGATSDERDKNGKSAMDLAEQSGNKKLSELLRNASSRK